LPATATTWSGKTPVSGVEKTPSFPFFISSFSHSPSQKVKMASQPKGGLMAREEPKEPLKITRITPGSLNALQRELNPLHLHENREVVEAGKKAIEHVARLRALLGTRAAIEYEKPVGAKYKEYYEKKRLTGLAITEKTKKLREALEKINQLNQSV